VADVHTLRLSHGLGNADSTFTHLLNQVRTFLSDALGVRDILPVGANQLRGLLCRCTIVSVSILKDLSTLLADFTTLPLALLRFIRQHGFHRQRKDGLL
jgi:hypothetical protein